MCISTNQEHNVANAGLNHLHGYIKLCWWICCIVLIIDYPASVGTGRTRCDARCDANTYQSQRTHGVTTTSLFHQNDVATSFRRNNDTSNGSWCMGIKGEMSGTVCVTFTWYMYIYELFFSFCLFCCLFIIVTTQFVALYKPCKPKPKFW